MTDNREVVVTPGMESAYETYHYASAVRASGLVFCSGVIGSDNGAVPHDPERQFTVAFESLGRVLHSAGCGFTDIVEITTYHVSYPRELDTFMAVRDRFLSAPWPAWTAVGVASLSRPEVIVEIRATAAIPATSSTD